VGDEQEEYYAARRVAFEQQFQTLPTPGTADYWQRIEQVPKEMALPLEVLGRCLRERLSTGTRPDAERIFGVIVLRIQSTVQFWANTFASKSQGGQGLGIAEDLESESYLALWQELASSKRTFLFVNFHHALKRIIQHAAHAFMEQEGFWTRAGVEHPTRIQRSQAVSLEASKGNDPNSSLADTLPDPLSQFSPGERELRIDLEGLLAQLDPRSRLIILAAFIGGYTQKEIAAWLNTTDRTIRNHIEKILGYLHRHLGGEEEHRG
jgi:RNA polymerase sigma factor (sigma-70 family)